MLGGRMSQKLLHLLEVKRVVCPQLLDSIYKQKHQPPKIQQFQGDGPAPERRRRRMSMKGSSGVKDGQAVRIMKHGSMLGLEGGVIDTDWNDRVKVQLGSGKIRSYLPEELTHVNEEAKKMIEVPVEETVDEDTGNGAEEGEEFPITTTGGALSAPARAMNAW